MSKSRIVKLNAMKKIYCRCITSTFQFGRLESVIEYREYLGVYREDYVVLTMLYGESCEVDVVRKTKYSTPAV